MYYELYIDVFFLVNFMMDVCILLLSKKILKCPATYGNICFGSLLGSFLTSMIIILPIPGGFVKFLIFHGLITILMIKTGLRVKSNRRFWKAYIVVYMSAFLIGGIFSSLKQYMREISIYFFVAFISYSGAMGIWNYLSYMARTHNNSCMVRLYQGENQVEVNAIFDTGNRLRDTLTGKPVSIISRDTANKLWQNNSITNLRYIPYHTIGKKEGVLPVFIVDQMCLCLKEEIWIRKVPIAVLEDEISMDEYEMILNPDIR